MRGFLCGQHVDVQSQLSRCTYDTRVHRARHCSWDVLFSHLSLYLSLYVVHSSWNSTVKRQIASMLVSTGLKPQLLKTQTIKRRTLRWDSLSWEMLVYCCKFARQVQGFACHRFLICILQNDFICPSVDIFTVFKMHEDSFTSIAKYLSLANVDSTMVWMIISDQYPCWRLLNCLQIYNIFISVFLTNSFSYLAWITSLLKILHYLRWWSCFPICYQISFIITCLTIGKNILYLRIIIMCIMCTISQCNYIANPTHCFSISENSQCYDISYNSYNKNEFFIRIHSYNLTSSKHCFKLNCANQTQRIYMYL